MASRRKPSKRRSDANSNSWLPESLVFFLDRSLGKKKVARALRQAGADVRVHDDMFRPDEKDEVWLTEVGRRGWIVLTHDRRIPYRRNECEALMRAGVRAFVMAARGDLKGEDIAAIFVRALPAIRRFAARTPLPYIAKVTRSGRVELLKADH